MNTSGLDFHKLDYRRETEDGQVVLSDAPGLGVELDQEICRQNLASGESLFD